MTNAITTTAISQTRIDAVDALRGFALVGVGLAHMLEQNVGAAHVETITQVAAATLPDHIIRMIHQVLIAGKFYILFSLLFGLSFFIQIDKSMQRGEAIYGRFAWRLAILFLFGYIHHLFYRGDILMLYAVLGLTLLVLNRLSTRVLVMGALALFLGLGRFISHIFWDDSLVMDSAESPANRAYFETLKSGSLLDVFAVNNFGGLKNLLAFQFGIYGRGYTTLGLFMVGICLGRSGIFATINRHKTLLKKTMLGSSGIAVICFASTVAMFSQIEQPPTSSTWLEAFALTFYDLFNLSLASVYACAFLLLVTNRESILKAFSPFGRMALTHYLLQSLIGTFIFYGWGLGRLGEWPNKYILLTAVAIAATMMLLSQLWLKHFYYGPCEWLWRTLALRKCVRIRRTEKAGHPSTECPNETRLKHTHCKHSNSH